MMANITETIMIQTLNMLHVFFSFTLQKDSSNTSSTIITIL